MNYKMYINSDEWKEKKGHILKRDNYECQGCGVSDVPLDVHHITYDRLGNELFSDLITYCRKCHNRIHKRCEVLPHTAKSIAGCTENGTYVFYENENYAIAEYEDRGLEFIGEQYMAKSLRQRYDGFFLLYHHKGAMCLYPQEAFNTAKELGLGDVYIMDLIDGRHIHIKDEDGRDLMDGRSLHPMRIKDNRYGW